MTTPNTTHVDLDSILELTQNTQLVSDGPLSALYASALNKLYAKKVDEETGISIESAANDQLMMKSLWLQEKQRTENFKDSDEAVGMLYGVRKGDAAPSDIIVLSDVLSQMTPVQKALSAVVIDTTPPEGASEGDPEAMQTPATPFDAALEGIALAHGVRVFTSLEAYLAQAPAESEPAHV